MGDGLVYGRRGLVAGLADVFHDAHVRPPREYTHIQATNRILGGWIGTSAIKNSIQGKKTSIYAVKNRI